MHYLLTGGTGFIGSALAGALVEDQHQVTILSRGASTPLPGCTYIDRLEHIDAATVFDGIVNLAGASLADRRWTKAYKGEIISSRLDTTGAVIDLCRRLEQKPPVLISASAVGYYGHQADQPLVEDSAVVPGFSQELCQRWEATALEAEEFGMRVCLLRLGVVLGPGGGAFARMALPFRFGVANWLGHGGQWLSWVHLDDVVRASRFLLLEGGPAGPFNLSAPQPVTSRMFCEQMKSHRRTVLTAPMPAAIMQLMLGEMADELLLNGQRVLPARLQEEGFEFNFKQLDQALADLL